MIQRQLITQPEPDVRPVTPSPPAAPARTHPPPAAALPATESEVESASSGLPQRRRRADAGGRAQDGLTARGEPRRAPARADAGARFSAFRAAGRGTRPSAPSEDSR